jgi:membrane associated rhomboid family serine protease
VSDPLGGLAPEELREPLPRPAPRPKRPFTPTTWAILGALAVAFAAEGFVGQDTAVESTVALLRLGALYLPAVRDGDWWRLGSYAFLHIGWVHIAMNAWALWILAPQLEMTYGSNLTMGMFAATAMAGGGASILWAILRGGQPVLAAGASGGLFGLFGATVALAWRLRHRIPPDARKSVFRRVLLTLVINVAIAAKFPVDSAAHLGGLLFGVALGLIAPILSLPPRRWHRAVQWGLIASALLLAAMEGAAFARAVKPKPRTLRGAGVEAQVPGLFVPLEPGIAVMPGEASLEITRDGNPLQIQPGDDAVRIGDRTWIRERAEEKGAEVVRLAASEGGGRVLIELACVGDFCRGAKANPIYEQVARTIRVTR